MSHEIVDAWFGAMRRGREGEPELLALFHDDAVYVEPFSGAPVQHVGKQAIRACFRKGWEQPMPDLTLRVDRVDVDGDLVRAEWVCATSAWPTPIRGVDSYTLRDGRISRLETALLGAQTPPEPPPSE